MRVAHLFFFIFFAFGKWHASCQSNPHITDSLTDSSKTYFLKQITILGNKLTKRSIILREIPLQEKARYTSSELQNRIQEAKKFLLNTTLFHNIEIEYTTSLYDTITLLVSLQERWFYFPVPYFKQVDRNLNQWLVENKGNLNRVYYGLKFYTNNITGNKDYLRLWLINGYARQFQFQYQRPYISRNLKWGLSTGLTTGKSKEINYLTAHNKQVFYKRESFARHYTTSFAEVSYRPLMKITHRLGLRFIKERVADSVILLNASFFPALVNKFSYTELYYNLSYVNADYVPYLTQGAAGDISISHILFAKNLKTTRLTARHTRMWPVGKSTYAGYSSFAAITLPYKQPFLTRKLLGYGDAFLQGYEYYVMDGVAAAFLKTSLTKKMLTWNLHVPVLKKLIPATIPVKLYGRLFANSGYAYNPGTTANSMNNRMLYSYGVGLHIVSIYDFVLRIEWSFNHLGENGLFLHRKSMFL